MRFILLLFAGMLVPVSGCFTCTPTLDVRHCPEAVGDCNPAGRTVAWDQEVSDLFPDLAHFIDSLEEGEHGHADWTVQQADAFWNFYHVSPQEPRKQVFLDDAGQLFRVRVLSC